jgi:hypothetical protein
MQQRRREWWISIEARVFGPIVALLLSAGDEIAAYPNAAQAAPVADKLSRPCERQVTRR